jgi:hypothetical protein
MNEKNFITLRKVFTYRQTINALPETIFPLLCPERETEWLDGWTYNMIYSKSGIAEPGALFSTSGEGEEDTVWIITRHDSVEKIVEFARFTPRNRACLLTIKIEPIDNTKSYVNIKYSYTGLTAAGNNYINEYSEEQFENNMRHWEDSMNYFIKTGKMLQK